MERRPEKDHLNAMDSDSTQNASAVAANRFATWEAAHTASNVS